MTEIYEDWVDFGIDGFRIDTVKHVNMEFWQQFAPAIRDHAARHRQRRLLRVRRGLRRQPGLPVDVHAPQGRLDATLDFGFQGAGIGFAKGGADHPAARLLRRRRPLHRHRLQRVRAADLPRQPRHGPRSARFLDDDVDGDRAAASATELAHALMYLTRGQPVVYYGDEQGFTGDGGDKDARQDMFASQVATYNDDDLIGTDATTRRRQLRHRAPALPHDRATSPSCARPTRRSPTAPRCTATPQTAPASTPSAASTPSEDREYVVAVNNADDARRRSTFATARAGGTFRQVWPASRAAACAPTTRRASPSPCRRCPRWSTARPARSPTRADAPAVRLDDLTRGRRSAGRGARRGRASRCPTAASTRSPSPGGRSARGLAPLGTDDNAPYRVFHDVAGAARGAPWSSTARCCATAAATSSATSTWATVGEPGRRRRPGGARRPGHAARPRVDARLAQLGDRLPRRLAARVRPGPDDARRRRAWSGRSTVTLPGRQLRLQGRHRQVVGRELRRRRRCQAGPTSRSTLDAPTGRDLLLRPRHATGSPRDAEGPIVTAAGSFQSELGCPGDWQPDCMRSWLKDPDGDGTYTFADVGDPGRQLRDQGGPRPVSWDENYGAGGVAGGGNIAFNVPRRAWTVRVQLRPGHARADRQSTRAAGATPDLTHGEGPVAATRPGRVGRARRRHAGATGCTGRPPATWRSTPRPSPVAPRVPLHHDPAGLPRRRAGRLPAPRGLRGVPAASRRPREGAGDPARARSPSRRTPPTASCSTRPACRCPASSTTCTPPRPAASSASPGSSGRPTLSPCGRPTAQDVDLRSGRAGAPRAPSRWTGTPTAPGRVPGRRRWTGASLPLRRAGLVPRRPGGRHATRSPTRTPSP